MSYVWLLAIITVAHTDAEDLGVKAKMDILDAKMRQFEKLNNELAIEIQQLKRKELNLERKITDMQTTMVDSDNLFFDCYLTESWTESGPIRFNGCEGITEGLILNNMIL